MGILEHQGFAQKLVSLEQWCVGYVRMPIGRFLADPRQAKFQWIKPERSAEILADPFGIEQDGRLTIYAEQLIHGRKKGQIVALTEDNAPAPALSDRADARDASARETPPPDAHGIGRDTQAAGDLVDRDAVSGEQQRLRLDDGAMWCRRGGSEAFEIAALVIAERERRRRMHREHAAILYTSLISTTDH